MRGSFVCWLSAALLFCPVSGIAQDLSDLRSGVVRITSTSPEGKRRTGSGFIVQIESSTARIVTAAHVVAGDKNPSVEFFTQPGTPVGGKVYRSDLQTDVAVIVVQTPDELPGGLRTLRIAPEPNLVVGQDVHTIGFPPSLSWAISKPNYASDDGILLALIGGNIDEGNSGGPVLKDDLVVAMIAAAERGSGRAVPAWLLTRILQAWRIDTTATTVVTAPRTPAATSKAPQAVPRPPTAQTTDGPAAQTFKDCDDCPEMVPVPAGRFTMGSPGSEAGRNRHEGPTHEVVIPAPFAVSKYEVTRGQFARFVRETGRDTSGGCWILDSKATRWRVDSKRNWRDPGFPQTDEHPVVCVSWEDAKTYTQWLAEKTGEPYRLLSEAEWEYVARANSETARFWGDGEQQACEYANVADRQAKNNYSGWTSFDCDDGYTETAPVGTYKPNAFGLHDMLGNAWEWVEDCWNKSYAKAPNDGTAWLSGDCKKRVLRGGSWSNDPNIVRSAFRNGVVRSNRKYFVNGFRVAKDMP
jgi:formylglycine-generating enzyme required for sulfatase activity